jgi:hypothetical protein
MIRLIDILNVQGIQLGRYKIHLATPTAGSESPLEAYWRGAFKEWQEEQKARNFQCETVIGLIHWGDDRWLFAGVFQILGVQAVVRTILLAASSSGIGEDSGRHIFGAKNLEVSWR